MDDSTHKERIYLELIRQTLKLAPIAITASLLNASILVVILWKAVSHPALIIWLSATLCVAFVRSVFLFKHPPASLQSNQTALAVKWLVGGLALSGILWGFAGVFLFPLNSPTYQVPIVFVLCGMVAGATGAFSSFIPAFMAFTIPALAPIVIRFLIIGGPIYYGMSAMTVLYFVLTFIIVRRINTTNRRWIELKDHFARMVAVLEDSNTQLQSEMAERRRVEETLRNSEAQLRLLSSRLLLAQEDERKRIAHELHDSIGGVLSAIKFDLENTLAHMREGAATADDLERLALTTQHAIEESRRIYMELRPSILDDLGLIATIGWFARQFEETYKDIQVEKHVELQEEDIPKTLKIILFRVIQEAFHNIAKHSQATLVDLSLTREDNRLTLAVSDNGEGFVPADPYRCEPGCGGLGLESMQERVESSGGVLLIRSSRGLGATIQAMWDLG